MGQCSSWPLQRPWFSNEDREKNIRRVAEAAKLLYEAGNIVICSLFLLLKRRKYARVFCLAGRFIEIYVKCSIEVCKRRDLKDFTKAEEGIIKNFTGISDPYEEPVNHEITAETDLQTLDDICNKIEKYLVKRNNMTSRV